MPIQSFIGPLFQSLWMPNEGAANVARLSAVEVFASVRCPFTSEQFAKVARAIQGASWEGAQA